MLKLPINNSSLLVLIFFVFCYSAAQDTDADPHKLIRRAAPGGKGGDSNRRQYVPPDHPDCTTDKNHNTFFSQIRFDLQSNNSVWDQDGNIQFNISNEHHIKHGFYILNSQAKVVFVGIDKRSAACGIDYTYHARNTSTPLSLQLKTRGMSTDRWFMKFDVPGKKGQSEHVSLKYHRDGEENWGPIMRRNETVVEISRCSATPSIPWLHSRSLTGYATQFKFMTLDYPLEFFFGLYELSDKRKDRCGV